jgi:regulator of protease activity HflC (stomatin/prohibitin superfamily)
MSIAVGCLIGLVAWFLVRYLAAGLFTVNQNERAVKTSFGRAQRLQNLTTLDDPISALNKREDPTPSGARDSARRTVFQTLGQVYKVPSRRKP